VDSEIPSPVHGRVIKLLYKEDDVVEVGKVVARIDTGGDSGPSESQLSKEEVKQEEKELGITSTSTILEKRVPQVETTEELSYEQSTPIAKSQTSEKSETSDRFYSPLVKSIASEEGIGKEELDKIPGTGAGERVTKSDILAYIKNRLTPREDKIHEFKSSSNLQEQKVISETKTEPFQASNDVEIVEMDRMRKLIADHMVQSKRISPHVTSFAEADVTRLFNWRNNKKDDFEKKFGEKLTFTPIFIEIVAKALREHPRLNVSVDGDKILFKKNINIGVATALPSGNLIVPVIQNADMYNLHGLAKNLNQKVDKARKNKLEPVDIQNGTFTITNIGTYGNILGTPIINQPQVAILATGAIKKKPIVIESEEGDAIGIRHMMYLSLSYDHRVVDGYVGGTFLQSLVRYLEGFDDSREL
jgi:2-oxoglutarate dehydrogenase E2 component (dihydrolipoamide succinyltransferase)